MATRVWRARQLLVDDSYTDRHARLHGYESYTRIPLVDTYAGHICHVV
ncbi:hypothetical protein [Haladaptatus sp. NG-SE-30]